MGKIGKISTIKKDYNNSQLQTMENQGLKTTQRGGIMRHFQMHVYRKTDFQLRVYRHFFGQ